MALTACCTFLGDWRERINGGMMADVTAMMIVALLAAEGEVGDRINAGDGAVAIIGSNNHVVGTQVVYTAGWLDLEIALRRAAEAVALQKKSEAEKRDLQGRLRQLQALLGSKDQDVVRKTNELLGKDIELSALARERLELMAKLQSQVPTLTDPSGREIAAQSLAKGDFDEVEALIREEERRNESFTRTGPLIVSASDLSAAPAGLNLGLYLSGISQPIVSGRYAGLTVSGSGEFVMGASSIEAQRSFFMMIGIFLGPRFRLGAPSALFLEAGYYAPLLLVQRGSARFPLVGVGAQIGWQRGPAAIGLLARYSFHRILYPSEPDLVFFGLGLTLLVDEWRRWGGFGVFAGR